MDNSFIPLHWTRRQTTILPSSSHPIHGANAWHISETAQTAMERQPNRVLVSYLNVIIAFSGPLTTHIIICVSTDPSNVPTNCLATPTRQREEQAWGSPPRGRRNRGQSHGWNDRGMGRNRWDTVDDLKKEGDEEEQKKMEKVLDCPRTAIPRNALSEYPFDILPSIYHQPVRLVFLDCRGVDNSESPVWPGLTLPSDSAQPHRIQLVSPYK